MVEQHLCTFCENLPTTSPSSRSGKVSHCPLCHGEILMTGGGVTYRITFVESPLPIMEQAHPWRWVLAAAGIAILGLAAWMAVRMLNGDSPSSAGRVPVKDLSPPTALVQAKSAAGSLDGACQSDHPRRPQ